MSLRTITCTSILVILSVVLSSFSHGQQRTPVSSTDSSLTVKDTVVPVKNSKEVDQLISYAKKFLGTPYRYAGSTPSGFDCSGFINYVFGNFGFQLTRTSYGLAEFGEQIKLAEVRPGDLLFFKGSSLKSTRVGHVAMVIEVTPNAINMIHSSSGRGVVIENFKTSRYFIARFIKAKRLDYGVMENK